MSLDPVLNFAKVTVDSTHDDNDTSIALSAGHGARLPDPAQVGNFNLVWYNDTDFPDPADDPNREIVRCTARSTDTLTITRAQEGTNASDKGTVGKTYKMVLAITKKMIDDIQTGLVSYAFADNETPSGSIPGTSFSLAHIPISGSLRLYRNGVLQIEGTNYSIVGTAVTMTGTVQSGNTLRAWYRYAV